MNTVGAAVMNFSIEVITLPVSDVDRALRFYVDRVGFTLDVDYARATYFASFSSHRRAPAARSRSATDLPMHRPDQFAASIWSSQISRRRGVA